MEKLTMPTNRIPKAIQARTLVQSARVNLLATLILSFSQPTLAQSQQKPFACAGQNLQALNETLRGRCDEGGKPTGNWSQVQSSVSELA
jgi:hypothetical protein